VHGYHERAVADVPVDGRRVLVRVRVRRMRCPVTGCPRQTFREQVPGVLDRWQRRAVRLTGQISAVVRELAGRAGARLLAALGVLVSGHTALRVLLRIPLPALVLPVPGSTYPIPGLSRLPAWVAASGQVRAGFGSRWSLAVRECSGAELTPRGMPQLVDTWGPDSPRGQCRAAAISVAGRWIRRCRLLRLRCRPHRRPS